MKSKSIFLILLAYTNGMVLFVKSYPPAILNDLQGIFYIKRALIHNT